MRSRNKAWLILLIAFAAPGSAVSEIVDIENEVFRPGDRFVCSVQVYRETYLSPRAAWEQIEHQSEIQSAPNIVILRFPERVEIGEAFSVSLGGGAWGSGETGFGQYIQARENWNNGADRLMFYGSIGQGSLTASIATAGIEVPVRMTWSDLAGGLWYDMFLHCAR